MAKIFETNFNKGSLVETITGNVATLTNASLVTKEKGLCLKTSAGYATYTVTDTMIGDKTFVLSFYLNKLLTNYDRLFGNNQVYPYFNGALTSLFFTSDDRTTSFAIAYTFKPYTWYHLIITRTSTGATVAYVNNIQTASGSSGTPVAGGTTYYVGVGESTGNTSNGYFLNHTVYNHIFTEQERAAAYRDFLNSAPIVSEKYPNVINKPMDLSREKDNTIGPSILPNPLNLLDASWTIGGNAVKISNTSFSGTAVGDYLRNATYLWTLGTKYRIRIRFRITAGEILYIRDWSNANTYWTKTGDGNYNTYDETFTVSAIGTNGIRLRLGGIVATTIEFDYLIIEPITGLVAAYSFPSGEGMGVDISGNSNPITFSSKPIATKNGLNLNGKTQYGIFTSNPVGSKVYTIAFTIIPRTTDSMFVLGYASSTTQYIAINSGTTIIRRLSTGGSASATIAYKAGIKNTFVITRNGTTTETIYVNGIPVNLTLNADEVYNVSRLGIANTTTGDYFNGEFVDLRFYNRALILTEVKAYHNSFVQPSLVIDFKDCGADNVAF